MDSNVNVNSDVERFTELDVYDVFYNLLLSIILDRQERNSIQVTQSSLGTLANPEPCFRVTEKNEIMKIIHMLIQHEFIENIQINEIFLTELNAPVSMIEFINNVKFIKSLQTVANKKYDDSDEAYAYVIKHIDVACDLPFVKDLVDDMYYRLQDFHDLNNIS